MNRSACAGERGARETGVVGYAHRLDALHEPLEPLQVPRVQPGGRAEREAHSVQAHRVMLAGLAQHRERGAAIGEEVLGVNLDKRERRPVVQHRRVVGLSQAYSNGRDAWVHSFFAIAALASSRVLPPIFAQLPLAT